MTSLLMSVNSINKRADRIGYSGSTVRAKFLSRYFTEKQYDLIILTTLEGTKYFKADRLPCHFFITNRKRKPYPPFVGFIINFLLSVKYLKQSRKADIIYSTSDLLPDVAFSVLTKLLHRNVIFICGCHLLVERIEDMKIRYFRSLFHQVYSYYSQRFFLSILKRVADLVLVSNDLDRRHLIKDGFHKSQVTVAYGAPDPDHIKNKNTVSPPVYDLVFIGNEHPRKGMDILEHLLEKLTENGNPQQIALVGSLCHLEKRFGRFKNIHFTGVLSGAGKYDILSKSKLLILPSYHESFSMVACEALSTGTPVVAFDTSIFRSIYQKGMIFVPYADKENFHDMALSLVKDDEKIEKLSREALLFGREFSWRKTGEKMDKAMTRLAKEG